jgi:hypothetical protein
MMSVIVQYDPKQENLDNTIKLVDTGYYEADNGRVKSEFYEVGNEVVFINKGRRISWKPENMKYLDEFGIEDVIYSVKDVPLEVKANYARFNRSMPDIDDWFIQENDRLKHQIIVQGFQREPNPWLSGNIEFIIGGKMTFDTDLKVVANGIEQTGDFETDGAIHLYDGDTLVFTLPEVVAFDSAFDRNMTFGKYRVTQETAGEFSFDIVLSNEWVSSLDRVYPIIIDPTVVVSSGYSTAGNGGRKLVRLSNGWLVAIVYSNNYDFGNYLYKSTDNGQTWQQLCQISNTRQHSSIVAKGNYVYVLINQSSFDLWFYKIDVITQTNVDIYNLKQIVDSGQNDIGSVSLTINETGTELHAAWSSKNSTYPNSFNIRYAKGTIETDGSVTWGSVEQLTTYNSIGTDLRNPSIIINSFSNPVIIYDCYSGTTWSIGRVYYTGTSWSNSTIAIYQAATGSQYTQSSPSAIFVPQSVNGVSDILGVAWHGYDSTHTSTFYIRFSKSTDGGTNWSAMQKLVPGQNASLTADKNGKLYITYEDPADGKIKRIESTDNGDSWSSPFEVDTGTNPSMMIDHTFTSSLVGWVYMSDSSVKFDKIVLNQPPNAPILDTRTNFDATDNVGFSWTYNDPDPSDSQSAYQLEIFDVGTSSTVYNTGKVASTTSSHTLPAGTLVNNKQYQWRVKTWDSSDVEGPYSDYLSFYTSVKPSVTITNPTDSATVTESSITVQWSFSDPESEGQSAYQVELLDNADTVIENTGKVSSTSARSKTLSTTLQNNTTYKVRVTVWDAKDVASLPVTHTFSVAYTPPAKPTITATSATGHIVIDITNPEPQGSEPNVTGNDIYKKINGVWVRIATNVMYQYRDYAVKSGKTYEYKVRAHGDNTTFIDSDTASASTTFTGVWLHDITNAENTVEKFAFDGDGRSSNWEVPSAVHTFAGRKRPVTETGEMTFDDVSFSLKLMNEEQREKLENLVKSRNVLCYRDGRGRLVFGVVTRCSLNDENWGGQSANLSISYIDYTEEV